ncbi:CcoQ/FixQ family Cbb3-type cytochrome c oxidase assembly chaperone [Alcaligenaceae bacterium]|nr:CcoQ/FixQ family Cbb3-type cytochrome c oxidase assembly chaperone [Alcaligenaceae bacterium]
MLGIVNGIMTAIAMLTFIGIVWWAFSRGRSEANQEASLLPFAVPDERLMNNQERSSHE